jgi:DNA-directed RNA polymerase specialized sigma subunit
MSKRQFEVENEELFRKMEEILFKIPEIKAEIKNIEIEIEELKDLENISAEAVTYSIRTGETYKISKPTEDSVMKISNVDSMIENLSYQKRKKERLLKKIENAIESLSPVERSIIKMRYFENEKWYNIAAKVMLYERQCSRINKLAISKIYSLTVEIS